MKIVRKVLIGVLGFALLVVLLFFFNVMWKSPPNFKVNEYKPLEIPIMDMTAYRDIMQTHRRPYIYAITSKSGGSVHVLGVEHLNNSNHPQFDSINSIWKKVRPDVALVEGRLGFLFTWFQDPVTKYGEGGLTSYLAKQDRAKLYTWEPTRNDEIALLMKDYSVDKIAMFYSLRPYFSKSRSGKVVDPEGELQKLIENRTDYNNIRGVFKSWKDLDEMWKKDFPSIDWRNYKDEKGWWPEGYLEDLWNASNLARDEHLIQTILQLVGEGKKVFVTMGASHAPRIEESLKNALFKNICKTGSSRKKTIQEK
ncbi:hypothetical protein GTQ40_08980 [Flavobacteriaceae bacterium R38]|nr:hypothetical protein [Flavobacteriaceae bacterium R38]